MLKRVLSCALMLLGAPSFAAVNQWSSVGPDGGSIYGGVNYLARSGSAVAVTTQGIYRTTDRGANWTRTFQFPGYGAYQGVATNWNPAQADLVLAHGDGSSSLLRSTDGGATWTRVQVADSTRRVCAVAFTRNGTYAWAATEEGRMYRSSDGGATWTARSTGLPANFPIDQIEVDAIDEHRVYLRLGFDIWRTVNVGEGWTRINGTGTYSYIAASRSTANVLLAVQFPNQFNPPGTTIYRSSNGGDTFVTTGLNNAYNVQFFPSGSRAMAIGNDREAFYTENDGLTWTTRGRLPFPDTSAMEISFDPANNGDVLVATNGGMAFSQDGGLTWSTRHAGIREAYFGQLLMGAAPSNYVYAPSYDHELVYRRDPASGAWIGIGSRAIDAVTSGAPNNFAMRFTISHVGGQRMLHMIRDGRYGRSTDDGATWEARGASGDGGAFTVDPLNTQIAYAGGLNTTVTKTTNGGFTWTPLGGGLPTQGIEHIVIHPTNTQILYAGKSFSGGNAPAVVYKSIDGGVSWLASSTFITDPFVWRLVMHPTRPETLYATTQTGVWATTNGGASWAQIYTSAFGGAYGLAVDPQSPDVLYASTNSQRTVVRSVDGGATWESLPTANVGLATSGSLDVALVPGQPATLVNSVGNFGLWEMEVAPDLRLVPSSTVFLVGAPETLTLTASNQGPFTATNVTVSVNLPATAAAATVQSGAVSCTQAAQNVNCTVPILRPNQSLPITLGFTPTTHNQHLRATISAYESDAVAANNTVDIVTERRTDLRAQLTSSADNAQTGTTFTYTLTVENAGPSAAASVQATLTLPANVTYASSTVNGLTCAHAAGVVTCNAAALAVSTSATATITVNAVTAGALAAQLAVTGEGVDPSMPNNSASKTVTLADPPPPPPPAPPAPTPNPPGGGGGGGGGGRLDYLLVGMLALMVGSSLVRRRRAARVIC